MLQGTVHVSELQRNVHLQPGQHYSCRTYVDPEYRGRALLQHMLVDYARASPSDDTFVGFVYPWNAASLVSLERIGWRRTGEAWTTHILGFSRGGERSLPPARPSSDIKVRAKR